VLVRGRVLPGSRPELDVTRLGYIMSGKDESYAEFGNKSEGTKENEKIVNIKANDGFSGTASFEDI
jgi:hypothetical protein